MTLVSIPLLDLRGQGPAALADLRPGAAERLLAAGQRLVPAPALAAMDAASRRWAVRSANPYRTEVEALAARLPRGVWFMNLCFEWGCTTGLAPAPASTPGEPPASPPGEPPDGGVRLLRTVDWPFHGLGREVVVARQSGPAGEFYNVTWPGFVGVVTAMAPRRFALALNQAPLVKWGPWPGAVDWIIERCRVAQSSALPPMHLARRAMETCRTFAEAERLLCETPVAMPAFFTLAGTRPGEGTIVERAPNATFRHPMPGAVANEWLTEGLRGRARGFDNPLRRLRLHAHCDGGPGSTGPLSDFDWVAPPVLNPTTRLAVAADAARAALFVRGYESGSLATRDFDLAAVCPAESTAASPPAAGTSAGAS